jgi:hypothetical protein
MHQKILMRFFRYTRIVIPTSENDITGRAQQSSDPTCFMIVVNVYSLVSGLAGANSASSVLLLKQFIEIINRDAVLGNVTRQIPRPASFTLSPLSTVLPSIFAPFLRAVKFLSINTRAASTFRGGPPFTVSCIETRSTSMISSVTPIWLFVKFINWFYVATLAALLKFAGFFASSLMLSHAASARTSGGEFTCNFPFKAMKKRLTRWTSKLYVAFWAVSSFVRIRIRHAVSSAIGNGLARPEHSHQRVNGPIYILP